MSLDPRLNRHLQRFVNGEPVQRRCLFQAVLELRLNCDLPGRHHFRDRRTNRVASVSCGRGT